MEPIVVKKCSKGLHDNIPENRNKRGLCRLCINIYANEYQKKRRGPRTCCKRGHPRIPDNTSPKGICIVCRRENRKKYQQSAKGKKADNANQRKRTELLCNSYVASLIGLPVAEVPPELIEFKQLTVLLVRKVREQWQTKKAS